MSPVPKEIAVDEVEVVVEDEEEVIYLLNILLIYSIFTKYVTHI